MTDVSVHAPDAWFHVYTSLPAAQADKLLMETLKEPVPKAFTERIDVIDLLLGAFGRWSEERHHDKILELARLVHAHQPHLSEAAFEYIDQRVVDIHLFRNQVDATDFRRFKQNPVKSIDTLLPLLDKLIFYGHTNLARDIAEHVFPLVKDAPGLIPGAESEFGAVLAMLQWQRVYESLHAGKEIDREAVIGYLEAYDYALEDAFDRLSGYLFADATVVDYSTFAADKRARMEALNAAFLRDLLEQKSINFSAADKIWDGALKSFERARADNGEESPFDAYFRLNKDRLDDYLAARMGFLAPYQATGFGVLWGLPYVYDFLRMHGWISGREHRWALHIVDEIKEELIGGYGDELWQFAFVHTWPPPDCVSRSIFEEEAKQFRQSFYNPTEGRRDWRNAASIEEAWEQLYSQVRKGDRGDEPN